jgi:hypothetical protein
VDYSKFGGTALAIAYTSDVASLQPNDMTVISVNEFSVWERVISYDIPAGLPPCPPGGCLCTWNWIHQSSAQEGYGNEIVSHSRTHTSLCKHILTVSTTSCIDVR